MWSEEDERRALNTLQEYYARQTTESRLNEMKEKNVEVTYQNIAILFPAIEGREAARIMRLHKDEVFAKQNG